RAWWPSWGAEGGGNARGGEKLGEKLPPAVGMRVIAAVESEVRADEIFPEGVVDDIRTVAIDEAHALLGAGALHQHVLLVPGDGICGGQATVEVAAGDLVSSALEAGSALGDAIVALSLVPIEAGQGEERVANEV